MSTRIYYSKDGTIMRLRNNANAQLSIVGQTDKDDLDSDPLFNGTNNYLGEGIYQTNYADFWFIFNFSSPVTIDKIAVCSPMTIQDMTFQVCSDSTDGYNDGSWVQVGYKGTQAASNIAIEHAMDTPTEATWFRAYLNSTSVYGSWGGYRKFFLFGDYTNDNFQFWNIGETAELAGDYPLTLPDAPNNVPYAEFVPFKIKNSDLATHSYTVSVESLNIKGDSIVSNYFRLSDDPVGDLSWNKTTTVTITDLPAGGFSDEIRLYADLTTGQNPADGYHYYNVKVTETA